MFMNLSQIYKIKRLSGKKDTYMIYDEFAANLKSCFNDGRRVLY